MSNSAQEIADALDRIRYGSIEDAAEAFQFAREEIRYLIADCRYAESALADYVDCCS